MEGEVSEKNFQLLMVSFDSRVSRNQLVLWVSREVEKSGFLSLWKKNFYFGTLTLEFGANQGKSF